jgi:hypothetical protein
MAMILFWSCTSGNKNDQARNRGARNQTSAASSGGQANSAGGLVWEAPAAWKVGPPQQMRVVTYLVSPVEGDADNAELAVFHFPGTGGAKDANLFRWEGQFEQPDGRNSADVAIIKEMEVNSLKITTIELSGTYKVSSGPMMEVKDKKTGYRLIGAIIEGPQGMVFFKMTGPEKTVAASEIKFMQMLKSAKSDS